MEKENNIIHRLIDRWLSGTCTKEEEEMLHRYFLQYDLGEEQLTDDAGYHPDNEQSKRIFTQLTKQLGLAVPEKKIRTLTRRRILRIAAVLIPFLLTAAILYFQSGEYRKNTPGPFSSLKYISNKGEDLKLVTLTDGSTVLLNRNASLAVDTLTFVKHRHIILKGEAYFDVTRNPEKPFTVEAGLLTTKVLGTTFNIDMDTAGAHTTVTLFTGSVSLGVNGSATKQLKPGQAALYDSRSGEVGIVMASPYALAWKTKEIICKHESFETIINYLQEYYGIQITGSMAITGKRFSGTLSLNGGLFAVLDRLLFVHQLHYKKNDDNTIIIF